MKLKTKFQDEDFELGEVVDASIMYGYDDKIEVCCSEKMKHRKYNSIKDFTDHWEDAPEEPKEYWCITGRGNLHYLQDITDENDKDHREIGNYFSSREEAEKVLDKLRAYKRLKDKGFFFDGRTPVHDNTVRVRARVGVPFLTGELSDDLDLLFGGE